MKKSWIIQLILLLIIFSIPLSFYKKQKEDKLQNDEVLQIPLEIRLVNTNEVMALEDYIVGVVSAEMPASYHLEALKAQAVAARTYAIYQTNNLKEPIETSTAHQVYFPVNNLAVPMYEKIKQAVQQTEGQIITYNKKIIVAMFHAASNGQTESAKNFSGTDYLYLQSTSSPEEKKAQTKFTLQQLNKLLHTNLTMNDVGQLMIERNNTNRVEHIKLGSKAYSGREFRELLSLPSSDFQITVVQNEIVVESKGYGHGVGMSQMGANLLAQEGYTYAQILQHYYSGTSIENIQYAMFE